MSGKADWRFGGMAFDASDPLESLESFMGRREVHVWCVLPDRVTDERRLATYESLMSPDERVRNSRFVFPRGRREHLLTRALVRTTLSRYHPTVDPRAWQFTSNAFGRPEIADPVCHPRLRFNLSHTDGLIVCLVAVDREVGIDVENVTRRQLAGVDIAGNFFSASEVAELQAFPPCQQPDRFFDYWTLKESYIKARGLGLQLPLDQFSFHLRGSGPIKISFGPRIDDDPSSWQFELHHLTPRHRLALAIRRRDEPDLTVRIASIIP